MDLFMLISLAASPLLISATANQNRCGCIDQSWCYQKNHDRELDCPLSHSLCSNSPLADPDPCLLDNAVRRVPTECKDGWTVATQKDPVNGFPNRMVSIIQNNLTDGEEHTMYIDGYNGRNRARFIFKSNDSTGNVPLFMTMFLLEEYIVMNEKKDGQWCQNYIRVNNKVSSGEWHMQFKVRMSGGKQQVDIQYLNTEYDTIYRFYPQTHIKRGDWFTFYEEDYYILGISWSRKKDVQFKTSPPPGSRIVIHGKLGEAETFNIYIKSDTGADKMQITGYLYSAIYFGRLYHRKNTISGYNQSVDCWNYSFTKGKTVVIVIEVTERGIKYYGDGRYICTFETDDFKRNDISQIDANGSLQVLGYGANTCQYYRY